MFTKNIFTNHYSGIFILCFASLTSFCVYSSGGVLHAAVKNRCVVAAFSAGSQELLWESFLCWCTFGVNVNYEKTVLQCSACQRTPLATCLLYCNIIVDEIYKTDHWFHSAVGFMWSNAMRVNSNTNPRFDNLFSFLFENTLSLYLSPPISSTVYLQRYLVSNRCSASSFNCRYFNSFMNYRAGYPIIPTLLT